MEIKADYNNVSTTQNTPIESTGDKKYLLPENTTIKGEITDIKNNSISIRTENGEIIDAKLLSNPDAKIGQEHSFTVKYINSELFLEMKEVPQSAMQKSVIADVLNSFSLKASEENLKLAQILLQNQFPITKENMQNLNRALKMMGAENIEKAIYLLKNNVQVSQKNVDVLEGLISGNIKLSEQLSGLLESINAIENPDLKLDLMNIIKNGEAGIKESQIINNLMQEINAAPTKAKIMEVFKNADLSLEGFKELADKITKTQPENKELINSLIGEKENKLNIIKNNSNELSKMLINEKDLTLDKFNNIIKNTLEKEGVKFENLKNSEIKDIFKTLFPDKAELFQKFMLDLKIPQREANLTTEKLMETLKVKPENFKLDKLEEFLNTTKENITIAKNYMQKTEQSQNNPKVLESLVSVKDNLEFVSQIKNNLFFQVPITIENKQSNTELLVFRDKNKKKNKGSSASALVSLDTINLGRFETYIQKNENQINCNFRLDNENIQKLVKEHIGELNTKLKILNYNLENYSFCLKEDNFTILEKEPNTEFDYITESVLGRISFDMRT